MKEKFNVTGMTCSACSARVEKVVNGLPGVGEANVNLLQNSMVVDYDGSKVSVPEIIKTVEKSGYGAVLKNEEKNSGSIDNINIMEEEADLIKKRLIISIIFLVPLMYISMGHMIGLPVPSVFTGAENGITYALTQLLLTLPIVYANRTFFIMGFKTLVHRAPNMDSLVALGASAALVYGVYTIYKMGINMGHGDLAGVHDLMMDLYFESAAMILTLITVGKYLEARSKGKTSDAIKKLMDLTPKTATVIRNKMEQIVPIEDVNVGDVLIVKSGESIPVDGVLKEGAASVDQSAVTGESLPVDKNVGDNVTAGTINKSGFFKMEAQKVGSDTTIAGIIKLVEDANTSKAPIARLADRVSGVFVPIVITIAVLASVTWIIAGYPFDFALSIGISILVISCPCALGLATPTAIMVGTGKGAEQGILFKTAESLEITHKIDTVILDKTGTVTEGKLSVTDIIPYSEGSEHELLVYAASAEALSEHPLGKTIVEYAKDNDYNLKDSVNFIAHAGRGIEVNIDGEKVIVGNITMMSEHDIDKKGLDSLKLKSEELADNGKTPLFAAKEKQLLGLIALSDTIKPSSRDAVKKLGELGIDVVMITGDNERTAKSISKSAGIKQVLSDVFPEDKEAEVRKLQEAGKKVAMIGDGINDSPALARADVGIAIGAGTDIAIESADVVLMKSDLMDAVNAVNLSKAVMRNIKQNLFWAFIYNSIGIPLAAGVLYPAFALKLSPMFAAAAMSLSSFSVVTNALRLRFFKADRSRDHKETIDGIDDNESSKNINDRKVASKKGDKTMKTITIKGMMCEHCSGRVDVALNELPGVKAKVDLQENKAIVETDGSIGDDQLKRAIEEAGYEVVTIE